MRSVDFFIRMQREQLIAHFDTSPAIKLLRSPLAPFVVEFLHRQFKQPGRLSVPSSDLMAALTDYLDEVHETHPDVLRDRAEHYLPAWSSGDTRWLQRSLEAARNEPVYQLTPHTEDVLLYLGRSLERDLAFVGTESRLRLVIGTLADLVAGASRDPEVRLSHLREERQRLDEEIQQILLDGGVTPRYEPAAVRERFSAAVGMLKELMADFRAVEERFKEITRQVQRRQLDDDEVRGEILRFALDAEDVLKREDQGVSFYEFVRFILSPVQQGKLDAIIAELAKLEELAQQSEGMSTIRCMVPFLIADAEKVMRTNQRLSASLRRLLDTRTASDLRRVGQVLHEIRRVAGLLADDPPLDLGLLIDVGVQIDLAAARTFWSAPTEFPPLDLFIHEVDEDQRLNLFRSLAAMHRLDWATMRSRVSTLCAQRGGSVLLSEVIEEFPPRAGVVELLGYMQIAKDDGHHVSQDRTEEIMISGPPRRSVRMPLVMFVQATEATTHA